jgi:hypothetical protein
MTAAGGRRKAGSIYSLSHKIEQGTTLWRLGLLTEKKGFYCSNGEVHGQLTEVNETVGEVEHVLGKCTKQSSEQGQAKQQSTVFRQA